MKKKKGTQQKYYKQLSKDVKNKSRHFKDRDTTKNDNRLLATKVLRLKQVFIQKYKQMYGEVYEIGTPEYTKHTIDMTPGQEKSY